MTGLNVMYSMSCSVSHSVTTSHTLHYWKWFWMAVSVCVCVKWVSKFKYTLSKFLVTYPAQKVETCHHSFQPVNTWAIHPVWLSSTARYRRVEILGYENRNILITYRIPLFRSIEGWPAFFSICQAKQVTLFVVLVAKCLQKTAVWYGNTEPWGTMVTCDLLYTGIKSAICHFSSFKFDDANLMYFVKAT